MLRAEFVFEGEPISAEIDKSPDSATVMVGDQKVILESRGSHFYHASINGRNTVVAVVRYKDTYYLDIDSVLFELKEPSSDGVAGGAGDHGTAKDKVFAPMPGKIVKIMVAVGDTVDVKQPLVIVEAMKMENQVNAKAKGTVKKVNFAAGDQVDTERPIIELEIEE